jgi:hypothetical protein
MCCHTARGSQVVRERESCEQTYPDDLATLRQATPSIAGIYPST